MLQKLLIQTPGKAIVEISREVEQCLAKAPAASGLCTVFVRHTSASLTIQENADPSVQVDILNWLDKHVPENDPAYTHTLEGADDMPAHIKSLITQTSLTMPYEGRRLLLGTWQGIYLLEHRARPHRRELVVHLST